MHTQLTGRASYAFQGINAHRCQRCHASLDGAYRTCNFTERNMSCPDKDGSSREGAGRVALFRWGHVFYFIGGDECCCSHL